MVKLKEKKSKARPAKKKPKQTTKAKPKYFLFLVIILLISFLAYLPAIQNGFLWDDEKYILDNPLIYSVNLQKIFSEYVMGNYHPLTILTLAGEYHFFELNAIGYHVVNITLHVVNVALVFYAMLLLTKKNAVALVTALLFGIHPLHVESVAWASELKDLLYTLFFLASFIFYLKFLKERQNKFYILALFLFLLALLSKAMAASLPVVLLITDYFLKRKFSGKLLLEKLPFFLLAILFGVVAVFAQKDIGATDVTPFNPLQRIAFACYGLITYLVKLIWPMNLNAYYPYPIKNGDSIPVFYYAYIGFVLVMAAAIFYTHRFTRKIIFGFAFYTATVFLVLQLLPVGGAIMADRYSYIPSIGIFYLAGEGLNSLWLKKYKWVVIPVTAGFSIFFFVTTYARCSIWKDAKTLWTDVINHTQTLPLAYYNRGIIFAKEGNVNLALADYSKAIEINPSYTEPYINRANLLRDQNKRQEALSDYNRVIELKPAFAIAYFNRGMLFMVEKKDTEALRDYNKAIALNPNYSKAYNNRGVLLMNENKYAQAIIDFQKVFQLEPNFAEAHFNMGVCAYNLGRKTEACGELQKARQLGMKQADELIKRICK
jgi:tetratricopeptide (TPR) repeat protein